MRAMTPNRDTNVPPRFRPQQQAQYADPYMPLPLEEDEEDGMPNEVPVGDEVRVTNAVTGGQKGSKLARYDLIPVKPLREVAEMYGRGALKYSERNWERGFDWSLAYAAAQRHMNQFWEGESTDSETGGHHLASVIFHCMSLMEFEKTHPELDNRPRTKSPMWNYNDCEAPAPLMHFGSTCKLNEGDTISFTAGPFTMQMAPSNDEEYVRNFQAELDSSEMATSTPMRSRVVATYSVEDGALTLDHCSDNPGTRHLGNPGGGDYVGLRDPWNGFQYATDDDPPYIEDGYDMIGFCEDAQPSLESLRLLRDGREVTRDDSLYHNGYHYGGPGHTSTAGHGDPYEVCPVCSQRKLQKDAQEYLDNPGDGDRHLPAMTDTKWGVDKRFHYYGGDGHTNPPAECQTCAELDEVR